LGKRVKGMNVLLNALKNISLLSSRIDRRPLYGNKDHSFVEALLISIPQGEKDIVPFPNNKFPGHS
jgi:hypothetical protein